MIWLRITWHYLKTHRFEVFLVLLSLVYFLFLYVTDPRRPGLLGVLGWLSYSDQHTYTVQAIKTAHLQLRDHYAYGPVYPLITVPFILVGLGASKGFLAFDAFAFAFVIWAVYKFMASITNQRLGAVTALALMFATPLADYTVIPWNSSVTLLSLGIVLYVASLRSKAAYRFPIVLLALATALAFGSRYIDAAWIFVLSATILMVWSGYKKTLIMAMLAFVFCLPVFWSNYVFFGSVLKTPYTLHIPPAGSNSLTSDQDIGAYSLRRIPNAAYGMLVSPALAGAKDDASRGLLVNAFWFVFALALPFSLVGFDRRDKIFLLALLGISLLQILFYLSFRGSGPGAVKFGTLHYFKTFWPALAICATVSLSRLFDRLSTSDGRGSRRAPNNKLAGQKINKQSQSRAGH